MNTPTERGSFTSISDIRAANAAGGWYFFSPDTMRFFSSRVHSRLFGGCIFVTSEQFQPSHGPPYAREYTIRLANADGDVSSVSPFQEYKTLSSAYDEACRLGMALGAA